MTSHVARLPRRSRLPFGSLRWAAGVPATDLFIVAWAYDLVAWKHIHPATLWGGLLIVASQPLRLMISGTPAWLAFAGWLTR